MYHKLRFILSFLALSAPARASDPTHWICWLGTHGDFDIHCIMDLDPVLDDRYDATLVDDRSPQRNVWSIPLYGPPFDRHSVLELTRSAMCQGAPDCTVSLRFPDQAVAER